MITERPVLDLHADAGQIAANCARFLNAPVLHIQFERSLTELAQAGIPGLRGIVISGRESSADPNNLRITAIIDSPPTPETDDPIIEIVDALADRAAVVSGVSVGATFWNIDAEEQDIFSPLKTPKTQDEWDFAAPPDEHVGLLIFARV